MGWRGTYHTCMYVWINMRKYGWKQDRGSVCKVVVGGRVEGRAGGRGMRRHTHLAQRVAEVLRMCCGGACGATPTLRSVLRMTDAITLCAVRAPTRLAVAYALPPSTQQKTIVISGSTTALPPPPGRSAPSPMGASFAPGARK
eukprot:364499-Chlamydomonas_euryale.AAC.4